MTSWACRRKLDSSLQDETRRDETHIMIGTMARRRRCACKPCSVSASQARSGRNETSMSMPVPHTLLAGNDGNENVDPNLVVPRRSKREHEALQIRPYNQGTWSDQERLLFLSGMRVYGMGRWKEIGTILTSRSNRQIKSHGQKIALRMSQGEKVLEELDAVEASEVLHARPGRTSGAATVAATACRNPSTGSIAIASPPIQQLDAHPQISSSAIRNERPPTESLSRGGAVTETAFVALMLCELKSATSTTMEDSSAFVTPSIP